MKHEKVNDAAVIGVPNDIVGEIPTAFVVKKPGSTISEKELVDYAAGTSEHSFFNNFKKVIEGTSYSRYN